jgi:glucose-6-phosphate isomerase
MNTRSPLECPSWARLVQHAESWRTVHLRELFATATGDRQARTRVFTAEAPGVRYDYSRQRLGAMTLRLLTHLAAERGFSEWREGLLGGSAINATENRAAWHTALRAGAAAPQEVKDTLTGMQKLVSSVREQKKFARIVNLGTGGSDLGPRLVADALGDGVVDVRFAANVDPQDLGRAVGGG